MSRNVEKKHSERTTSSECCDGATRGVSCSTRHQCSTECYSAGDASTSPIIASELDDSGDTQCVAGDKKSYGCMPCSPESRPSISSKRGRILIAGFIPRTYQAVYNGTKALLDSFAIALRVDLRDSGVTVTSLLPGPTQTEFFRRAELLDTRVGQTEKPSAADVASIGYEAMRNGEAQVIAGWMNKLQVAVAAVTPATPLAERHRAQAEPGSGASHG